jgi:CDP-glucose 4,6-dehydratase
MAAQSLVRESYAAPLETYAVNVLGTANVLQAVRETSSVRAVVSITSDKCYENLEWPWGYREADRLGGYDPYSSSKACAELVTAAYRTSFFHPDRHCKHGVAIATARAGNVIGGGDCARDRLFPDMLSAMARGEPIRIRSPHAVRPWQHVLEPLSGYLLLAEALASEQGASFGEAWNFGPRDDDARPVDWIVEQMIQRWGGQLRWERNVEPQLHEAGNLRLDSSKAHARLGWRPRWGLSRALDAIVDWQRGFLDGADMRATTLAQIADHQECRSA